ncbi:MAG: pirin-like C-terminal cupin domain-containing protein, partial [Burkholderiaceae bacterium]
VEGDLKIQDVELALATMALLDTKNAIRVTAKTDARFVLIGGEPLDGHRFMWWNFVSSSKERITQAADDWESMRFPKVPGETEWIPLPNSLR